MKRAISISERRARTLLRNYFQLYSDLNSVVGKPKRKRKLSQGPKTRKDIYGVK
jgi:hypothetical protein